MLKNILTAIFILVSAVPVNAKNLNLVCDEWPPYQIVKNENISGFSTEVVLAVLKKMGVGTKKLTYFPWKRAITILEKGRADALFSANYSQSRTAFAWYPKEPIVESPWVMWVREEDDLKFDNYDDLNKKHIGIVRGYSYVPEFLDFIKKHAEYEEVSSDDFNFKKLNAGRLDYVIAELGNGLHILKKLKIKGIVPLKNKPIKSNGLYIIFNKKNVSEKFVDEFSSQLKQFKQGALYQYLFDKYFTL